MERRVSQNIERYDLLNQAKSIIVGLSGGADSIVLIHILQKLGYNCIAAHCNFKLRASESDEDEEFVRAYCTENGISAEFITFNTKEIASERKISIEMAARELRYEWFEELRVKYKAQAIVVAHHANDQAETVLLNMTRGSGINGLTGMKFKNGYIIRPMLNITRTQIEDYCRLYKIKYRIDSSNSEIVYSRNKIRNKVIPILEEINPSIIETIYVTSKRLEEIQQFLKNKISEIEERITLHLDGMTIIRLDDNELKSNIHPLLFEILSPYGFINDQINKIKESIDKESGRLFYSKEYQLNLDRDKLIISPLRNLEINKEYKFESPGQYLEPIFISIEEYKIAEDFKISKEKDRIQIDSKKVSFPLSLRKWKQGDQFIPFGMKNFKKLSDFFIDKKISRTEKENSWILCDSEGKIIWIVGLRPDNRFRIDSESKTILEIKI